MVQYIKLLFYFISFIIGQNIKIMMKLEGMRKISQEDISDGISVRKQIKKITEDMEC